MEIMTTENKTLEGRHPRIISTPDFILRNNFSLSRTPEEILQRIKKEILDGDMFNFGHEVLTAYLPWSLAKEFYKPEFVDKVDRGEAASPPQIIDASEATQDLLDYLVFGWSKALDERGLSAARTVAKLSAWFWLLGREDLMTMVMDCDNYNPYGMPCLNNVAEAMGLEVPADCIEFAKHKC